MKIENAENRMYIIIYPEILTSKQLDFTQWPQTNEKGKFNLFKRVLQINPDWTSIVQTSILINIRQTLRAQKKKMC